MPVHVAHPADIPQLVALMNSAYRGEDSKKGWTTEAHLLEGEHRTDEAAVQQLMATPGAVFLKCMEANETIAGSVFLQKKGNRLYLGMLSVSPLLQARGIGRKLVAAAEEKAREEDCEAIYMTVISVRHELISWYERLGFYKTGATEPFPVDERYGVPTQALEFVVMEKRIK